MFFLNKEVGIHVLVLFFSIYLINLLLLLNLSKILHLKHCCSGNKNSCELLSDKLVQVPEMHWLRQLSALGGAAGLSSVTHHYYHHEMVKVGV